jgi:polar amino acid transport system substrate-binding protein
MLLAGCTGVTAPLDDGVPPFTAVPTAPPAPSSSVVTTPLTGPATGTAPCTDDPEVTYAPAAELPAPGRFPAGSRLAKIHSRGRLIAGVTSDIRLFGVRNPRSRTIEGFDIDLLHAISQAIFGDPNRIEFKVFPGAQRIPALKAGTVDVVARTMTATCERWEEIAFSAVYLRAQEAVLVRAGSGYRGMTEVLRAGARVCGSRGSTGIEHTKRLRATLQATKASMVEVETLNDCMALFQQERVDALVSDNVLLAGLVAQDPYAATMVGERDSRVQPVALGLPKDRDFVAFVNRVLANLEADGRWKASYDRWLAGIGSLPSTPPEPRYGRRS